ncbi:GerAB/ArcD/ProY family transporter [Agathobacter sp.]
MTRNMKENTLFAQNGEISGRQLYRLYVFNLLGVGTLVLPNNLARLGKYGFVSIILGVAMAWIFMWMTAKARGRHADIAGENQTGTEKNGFPSGMWNVIVAVYQLMQAAFLAWVFVKLIRDSLIPDESFTIVLLVIMAVCAYALSGGVECRARVYEVVFWFVLIPLIAMLLFAMRDINTEYIKIKDGFNIKEILIGTYLVFAATTSTFNILFIKNKSLKKIKQNVSASILTFAGIMLLLYAVLLGNFGKYALAEIEFPAVVLMSDVQLKGSFFKRADALMLAVWFFTLFSILNMSMFYASKMCVAVGNKMFNGKYLKNRLYEKYNSQSSDSCNHAETGIENIPKWCILLVTALTIAGAYILEYGDGMVKKYLGFLLWIGIPLIVLIVIALMFTGCSSVELEDRCFPTLAAVDIDHGSTDKIEFYYNMEKSYEPEYADSVESAVEQFEDRLPQKADTNHMKVLLIGKELYDDKETYAELMEYCKETRKIPRNTYVCVVDDINDIFDNMGSYYEQKIDKQEREEDLQIVTLGTLMDDYTNFKQN